MPYITQTARQMIKDGGPVQTAGELNYLITQQLLRQWDWETDQLIAIFEAIKKYVDHRGMSYGVANDIIGALECSRREFKRRRGIDLRFLSEIADKFYDAKVAPYEDQKIQQNGDLF